MQKNSKKDTFSPVSDDDSTPTPSSNSMSTSRGGGAGQLQGDGSLLLPGGASPATSPAVSVGHPPPTSNTANSSSGNSVVDVGDNGPEPRGCSIPLRIVLSIVAGTLVLVCGIAPLTISSLIETTIVGQVEETMKVSTVNAREVIHVLFNKLDRAADLGSKNVPAAFQDHVQLARTYTAKPAPNVTWDMPYLWYGGMLNQYGFPFINGVMSNESIVLLYDGKLRITVNMTTQSVDLWNFGSKEDGWPTKTSYTRTIGAKMTFWDGYEDIYEKGEDQQFTFTSPIGILYGIAKPTVTRMPDDSRGPTWGAFSLMDFKILGTIATKLLAQVQSGGYSFVLAGGREADGVKYAIASTAPGYSETTYAGEKGDEFIKSNCFNIFDFTDCRHTTDTVWPLFGKLHKLIDADYNTSRTANQTQMGGMYKVDGDEYAVALITFTELNVEFGLYAVASKDTQLEEFKKRQLLAFGVAVAVSIMGAVVIVLVVYGATTSMKDIINSMTHIAQLGVLSADGTHNDIRISELGEIDDAVCELNDELGKLKRFVPGYVRSALFAPKTGQQTFDHPAAANRADAHANGSATNPLVSQQAVSSTSSLNSNSRIRSSISAGAMPLSSGADSSLKVCVLIVHLGNCHLYDNQTKNEYVALMTRVVDILTDHHADVESMGSGQVIAAFRANKLIMPTAHACRCAIAITEEIELKLKSGDVVGSDAVVCIDFGRCEVHPFAGSGVLAKILNGNPLRVVQQLPPLARFLGVRIMVTADVASTCSYVTMVADSVRVALGSHVATVRLYELLSVKPEEADPMLLEEAQQVRYAFSAMLQGNYEEALGSMKQGINSLRVKRLKRLCNSIMSDDVLRGKGYCREAQERCGWNNLRPGPHTDSDFETPSIGTASVANSH